MSTGTGPDNEEGSGVDDGSPQPTVIVTGSVCGPHREVASRLFEARTGPDDGAVVITTRERPAEVLCRLEACGIEDRRIRVLDARPDGTPADLDGVAVGRLDPDADPAAFESAVEDALGALAEGGAGRRHFLYDGLAMGDHPVSAELTYDRAYRLAMALGAEDGLAVFAGDPSNFPEAVVGELTHLVDVHVELREVAGEAQVRWKGLVGGSDGWIPVGDADFGAGGFR